MIEKINYAEPKFWGNETKYVLDAVNSLWISSGHYLDKFEDEFKSLINAKYCTSVSNGTAALQVALMSLGLKFGDEVIVPGFGYMAAANVALSMGLKPIFVDVDEKTWCIDINSLSNIISKKTKVVIAIHTYGNMCKIDEIQKLCNLNDIFLIEDSAEALGSKYKNEFAGTIGDIGTFSFHAAKTLTTGEGGMISTNDKSLYEKFKLFKNQGIDKIKYLHVVPGLNFRLTNYQAAMGLAQLESFNKIEEYKKNIFKLYKNLFHDFEGVEMQTITQNCDPIIWAVSLKLNTEFFSISRDEIIKKFAENLIETRPGFYSSSDMKNLYAKTNVPTASKISKSIISLPCGFNLDEEKITKIYNVFKSLKR